jgi:hypothetical protein
MDNAIISNRRQSGNPRKLGSVVLVGRCRGEASNSLDESRSEAAKFSYVLAWTHWNIIVRHATLATLVSLTPLVSLFSLILVAVAREGYRVCSQSVRLTLSYSSSAIILVAHSSNN